MYVHGRGVIFKGINAVCGGLCMFSKCVQRIIAISTQCTPVRVYTLIVHLVEQTFLSKLESMVSPLSLPQKIAELLGLELADDIGEWVTDGVVPCQLVKKLHPQLMATFHSPAQGKVKC